jgi:hypothetical protein
LSEESRGSPVSAWARSHFGEDAATVRRGLVEGLHQAQQRAVLIQEMSGLASKQPYGGMWPGTYKAMEEQFLGVEGAYKFRPPNASYNLMVVRERLLLPFKLADNLNVPVTQARLATKIGRNLSLALSAAQPPDDLFSLLGEGFEFDPVAVVNELIHLSPATRIIYVPYVAHADAGLLKSWWGEGLIQADGTIAWLPGQPEELPAAKGTTAETSTGPSGLARVGGSGRAFDEGELPALDFPAYQRPVTAPRTERQPKSESAANDGDA